MDEDAPWRALEAGSNRSQPEGAAGRKWSGGLIAAGLMAVLVTGAALLAAVNLGGGGGEVELLTSTASSEAQIAATGSHPVVVVQVAGAVLRPGVYSLPAGSRVGDAIKLAGGYSADVDPKLAETALNLASKLSDSQLIVVPRRGDASGANAGGSVAAATSGVVDLNSATAEQLDTLPGIGPATAAKIIAAREQSRFTSVDDLVKRKIISAATLAKLKNFVSVK